MDHGVGVIFKRKNRDILKLNKKNFKDLKFSDYFNNHQSFMKPINHDEIEEIF